MKINIAVKYVLTDDSMVSIIKVIDTTGII